MHCMHAKYVITGRYQSISGPSGAYEATGEVLATVVDNEAELDRDVDGDAEHVGLDSGAEADGGLQVREAAEDAAARLGGRVADLGADEAQHVGARRELERVLGALAAG